MVRCSRCGKRADGKSFDRNVRLCFSCIKAMQNQARRSAISKIQLMKYKAWIEYLPECDIVFPDVPYKRQQRFVSPNFVNITPKGSYEDIVAFDVETTGLSPSHDRIIEIAAVRFLEGEPIEKFHSYINPERPIPEETSNINHITDDMVATAPVIGQVLPSFEEFVGKSILVAHNLEFDLKFIYYSGSKIFEVKRKYIDTLGQAQRILKRGRGVYDHKLGTLCEHYDIPMVNEHGALSDAFAAGCLFFELAGEKQDVFYSISDVPAEALSGAGIPLLEDLCEEEFEDLKQKYEKEVPASHLVIDKGGVIFIVVSVILLLVLYVVNHI